MEEDQNWLDKPSEERNLAKYEKRLDTLLCTPVKTLEWKVWYEELCSSEGDNFLCLVCSYCGGQVR